MAGRARSGQLASLSLDPITACEPYQLKTHSFITLKQQFWAAEVATSVKCLPGKCENLSLILRIHIRKCCVIAGVCDPKTR